MFKKIWSAIVEFLHDVRAELKKISYPTYQETVGSTTVVIVLVVIVSVFLAGTDIVLVKVISRII